MEELDFEDLLAHGNPEIFHQSAKNSAGVAAGDQNGGAAAAMDASEAAAAAAAAGAAVTQQQQQQEQQAVIGGDVGGFSAGLLVSPGGIPAFAAPMS